MHTNHKKMPWSWAGVPVVGVGTGVCGRKRTEWVSLWWHKNLYHVQRKKGIHPMSYVNPVNNSYQSERIPQLSIVYSLGTNCLVYQWAEPSVLWGIHSGLRLEELLFQFGNLEISPENIVFVKLAKGTSIEKLLRNRRIMVNNGMETFSTTATDSIYSVQMHAVWMQSVSKRAGVRPPRLQFLDPWWPFKMSSSLVASN